MKNQMKERLKSYSFILILSIIVCIPLFFKNFDIYGDDGIQHICRLMGTYQSIEEGQTFPVIMSEFCNQFGYSWNIFYSPMTAYLPLIFKLFTSSFAMCLKLFIVLITFCSGITMYEFLNKVTKNKYAGLLGAAIYIFVPYRLTDMYMRIAVAELTSFIFLPMVFHGIYNIFSQEEEDKEKSGILLAVGACGLILSHIIIAMYTAIFGAIYVLINFRKLKDKIVLKKLIINFILILCITSFFWAPLLEHKIGAEYEVFKPGRMEREDVLIYYKSTLEDLFYTKQGELITEIGLITVVGMILSIFASRKLEKRYTMLYLFSFLAGIISVIMTLDWFPFEKLPGILTMLQFTFRMLEFSAFFLSIVVAINYSTIIKNFKMKDVLVLTLIAILLVVPLKKNLKYRNNFNEESLWPAVEVTEKTRRVHAGCASFEYLPSKAFENLDYVKARESKTCILTGNCYIEKEQKKKTNMTIKVKNVAQNTTLELPYIYYLGYEANLEINGEITKLQITESNNGFIQIQLEEISEGKITVKYTGTFIMKISMIISILSFTMMILYYCKKKYQNITERKGKQQ